MLNQLSYSQLKALRDTHQVVFAISQRALLMQIKEPEKALGAARRDSPLSIEVGLNCALGL
jgi:hypothetical protein